MIIDTHIHFFPDKLAERTIASLSAVTESKPCTDGTLAGSKALLKECGVDHAIVLHIATKPKNQRSVNAFAAEVQNTEPMLHCFGSVHPDADDVRQAIREIKELGLLGVKLHPYYQDFTPLNPRADVIYSECELLGLPIVFHAGFDPYIPGVQMAAPKDIAGVKRAHPGLKVIAAHLGGFCCDADEVLRHIAGQDIYIDTAASLDAKPECRARHSEILKAHRKDRILFASDMPWSIPSAELWYLKRQGLTAQEFDMATHKNAMELFGADRFGVS